MKILYVKRNIKRKKTWAMDTQRKRNRQIEMGTNE